MAPDDSHSVAPTTTITEVRGQFGGEIDRLRRLWDSYKRTQSTLLRATIAYQQSRELLQRMDEGGIPQ